MERSENMGMVHVYTGNGKGKTTAALGQIYRAVGRGLKIYYAMFMKNFLYGEIKSFAWIPEFLDYKQYGNDYFIAKKEFPSDKLKEEITQGVVDCINAMNSGEYDIVVMDEIIVSIYFKLITKEEIIELIKNKPPKVELILTGRYCPEEIIELADLVTEMKEVKHYYQKGVAARTGIEC